MSCSYPWSEGVIWPDMVVQNHYMYRGTLVGAEATRAVNGKTIFESNGVKTCDELTKDPDALRLWDHLDAWLWENCQKTCVCEPVMFLGLEDHGFSDLVDIGRNYPDENKWWGAIDMWDQGRTIWDFKCAKRIRPEYWTQQLCLASMLPGEGPVKAHLVQVTVD